VSHVREIEKTFSGTLGLGGFLDERTNPFVFFYGNGFNIKSEFFYFSILLEYEEVAYEKPEVIMARIEGLEDQIKTNISELKGMLKQGIMAI